MKKTIAATARQERPFEIFSQEDRFWLSPPILFYGLEYLPEELAYRAALTTALAWEAGAGAAEIEAAVEALPGLDEIGFLYFDDDEEGGGLVGIAEFSPHEAAAENDNSRKPSLRVIEGGQV